MENTQPVEDSIEDIVIVGTAVNLEEAEPQVSNVPRASFDSTVSLPPIVSSTVLNQEYDLEKMQHEKADGGLDNLMAKTAPLSVAEIVSTPEESVSVSEIIEEKVETRKDQLKVKPGEKSDVYFKRIAPFVHVGELRDLLGKYDREGESFWSEFRVCVFSSFRLSGKSIIRSLREISSKIKLPIEGQQVERIVTSFSDAYLKQNSMLFKTDDHCFNVAMSIFILNSSSSRTSTVFKNAHDFIIAFSRFPNVAKGEINDIFLQSTFHELTKKRLHGVDIASDFCVDFGNGKLFEQVVENDTFKADLEDEIVVSRNTFIDYQSMSRKYPGPFNICKEDLDIALNAAKLRDGLQVKAFKDHKCKFFVSEDEVVKESQFDVTNLSYENLDTHDNMINRFSGVIETVKSAVSSTRQTFLEIDRPDKKQTHLEFRQRRYTMFAKTVQFKTYQKPQQIPLQVNVSNFDLTALFSGNSFISPQFLLPLSYFAINNAKMSQKFSFADQHLSYSLRITENNHSLALPARSKSFNDFLNEWKFQNKVSSYSLSDHVIFFGPMLKKGTVSSAFVRHFKPWIGGFYLLILPKSGQSSSAPALPELWYYNDDDALELQQKLLVQHTQVDSYLINVIETSIEQISLHESSSFIPNDTSKMNWDFRFPAPTKKIEIDNIVAFMDETYTACASAFHLAEPHRFPAPISLNSHYPLQDKTKPTRKMNIYLTSVNKNCALEMENIGVSEDHKHVRAALRGVGFAQSIKYSNIDEKKNEDYNEQAASFHQWKLHLNVTAAISFAISDLREIVKSSNVSGTWAGFHEMVKNYFKECLKCFKREGIYVLSPPSFYWLSSYKSEELGDHFEASQHALSQNLDSDEIYLKALKPVLNDRTNNFLKSLFELNTILINVKVPDQKLQIEMAKKMLEWLLLMYLTRKNLMQKKIEDCTRNVNQLEYALLHNPESMDQEAQIHLAKLVLNAGALNRRGYLAARNIIESEHVYVRKDGKSAHSKLSTATVHRVPRDKMEHKIIDDIVYFEQEIEWMRIEYERWSVYSQHIEMMISAMSIE